MNTREIEKALMKNALALAGGDDAQRGFSNELIAKIAEIEAHRMATSDQHKKPGGSARPGTLATRSVLEVITAIISAKRVAPPSLSSDSRLTSRHMALLLLHQVAKLRRDIAVIRRLLRETYPVDSARFESIFSACDHAAFAEIEKGIRDMEEQVKPCKQN